MSVLLFLVVLLHAQSWDELYRQSETLYKKGDLPAAARVAQQALDAAGGAEQKGAALDRLGFLQYSMGKRAEAEAALKQALEIREKLGRETEGYADTALNLAMLYRDMRRLDDALRFANEGTAVRAKLLGRAHAAYAEALNIRGSVEVNREDFPASTATYEEGLAVHEAIPEAQRAHEEYGTLCANFANVCLRAGRYEQARQLFEKALRILEKSPGKGHPAYSVTLAGAALLAQDMGFLEQAERMYAEVAPLASQQLGESHPSMGVIFNNVGVLHRTLGNSRAAEEAFRQSLEVKRKTGDKGSLALTIRNVGFLVNERDPAAAERLYREAVALFEQAPNAASFEFGNTLLSLAQAQRSLGRLAECEKSIERASALISRALPPEHPLNGNVLRETALLARARGDLEKAKQFFQRAIELAVRSRGERHPQVARPLIELASVHTEQGEFAAALPLLERALAVQDGVRAQALAVGSEAAKSAMLANLDDMAPLLIEFQRKAAIPAARRLAFEAVTSHKARTIDFIRDWRASLRESAGGAGPLLDQWQAFVDCEVVLSIAIGYRDWRRPPAGGCALEGTELAGRYERLAHEMRGPWSEARARQAREAIEDLRTRAARLEEELSRRLPLFREGTGRVSLESVCGRLRPGELLLEIVRQGGQYGAFLLDSSGALDWVDLGPAGPIDTAVADILEAAGDWSDSVSAREPAAAASAQKTASVAVESLSSRAFSPLWMNLAGRADIRNITVAPDSMLLLLPFEALTYKRLPLLRSYTVSYVLAGRDLVQPAAAPEAASGPLIAVSPGPRAARPASAHAFRTGRLERLAGAQREASQIAAVMPGARLLSEGEATEQALKQVQSPVLLHIIGHGLVRGAEPDGATSDVMNLSAIVLEEAYGRGAGSTQDGLLTARELRSLNLSSTAMLVLSQCRMADGVPTSGDGVYGMRRAAALSGVRSFAAPLWRISDAAQQRLVARFYRELSAGRGRAEALRAAKIEVQSAPATRHFFHWAPMILSGESGPLPAGLFARR